MAFSLLRSIVAKKYYIIGSSIKHFMLPKPDADGALTKRSITRGRVIAGSLTIPIGAKESPE